MSKRIALVCAAGFLLGCVEHGKSVVATTVSDSDSYKLTVGERDGFFKISNEDSSTLKEKTELCPIKAGVSLTMVSPAMKIGSHYFVRLKSSLGDDCPLREGYIHANFVASVTKKYPVDVEDVLSTFTSEASLYTVENNRMEGGAFDRCDYNRLPADKRRPLSTLEMFVEGKSNWVALAMDDEVVPYGTVVRIPRIEQELKKRGVYNGRPIIFIVTDGGGDFNGIKGWKRFDLCVGNSQGDIYSSKYNWMHAQKFEMQILKKGDALVPKCGDNFRPDYR
jgi:hypothetical protein